MHGCYGRLLKVDLTREESRIEAIPEHLLRT